MARDPQAALVALHRFGFGARGGSSGDFANAASDPRGFVKADLSRPGAVLLEGAGLLPTPALGQAMFAYQLEVEGGRGGWRGWEPGGEWAGGGRRPWGERAGREGRGGERGR